MGFITSCIAVLGALLAFLHLRYPELLLGAQGEAPDVYGGVETVARLSRRNLTCEAHPALCDPSVASDQAPDDVSDVGRWKKPSVLARLPYELVNASATTKALGPLATKRWSYMSFVTPRYFVGVALVRFSYVSDVFLYVVDRQEENLNPNATSLPMAQYEGRMPLGIGLKMAPSSVTGCSYWGQPAKNKNWEGRPGTSLSPWIEMCGSKSSHDPSNKTVPAGTIHRLRASVPVTNDRRKSHRVRLDVTIHDPEEESLILQFPNNGNAKEGLGYIHKHAGAKASGWLELDPNERVYSGETSETAWVGALDWTKSPAPRRTAWRWVSLSDARATLKTPGSSGFFSLGSSSVDTTVRIGINLSEDVYDLVGADGSAVSAENALWIDGKLVPLTKRVRIRVPTPREARESQEWIVQTVDPSEDENIDIVVRPLGTRSDYANLGLVVSDFTQPYGRFVGTVRAKLDGRRVTVTLGADAFGVVEDHLAVW